MNCYFIQIKIINIFQGKVVGFFDSWPSKRKFAVDMAGFAVNIEYLISNPNATMPYKAGYEEDQFLRSLGLQLEDIEPKADSCTQVILIIKSFVIKDFNFT